MQQMPRLHPLCAGRELLLLLELELLLLRLHEVAVCLHGVHPAWVEPAPDQTDQRWAHWCALSRHKQGLLKQVLQACRLLALTVLELAELGICAALRPQSTARHIQADSK